ncbi:hypothetical protein AN416_02535 [Paraburkholderia caribensis]|nr:hypothetical protein AN416_02535 [Paraburkholderia caribensis]
MRSSLKKKDQGSDKSLMKLAQECEPLLRVELRLMGSELRRLNLDQVWAWSASTAREVFRKYFARLPLADITFGQLKPEDFKGMDMRMRAAFAHHKLGTDLSAIYCKRTRERHLAYFRKRGFNLNVPNQPKAQLMLTDILSKPGVIAHAPKWLADAGMAPRAKSRNRGDPGNHSPRIVDCS